MQEILSDLVAEQQALDQFLQRVPIRDWKTPIPGRRWNIQDTVSYLALGEELAHTALDGTPHPSPDGHSYDLLREASAVRGRAMRPQDVIEWWRHERAAVVDALSRLDENDSVLWFDDKVAAKAFASARLADTWSHGLDIHAAMSTDVEETPRIRHIAWLGWETLPVAFSNAGESYTEPVRVEVIGANYTKWTFGPADTDQLIKGRAEEWCRLVARRLEANQTSLQVFGDVARRALEVARAEV